MAYLEFNGIRIAGIAASVPDTIVENTSASVKSADYDAEDFVKTTGVRQRRISKVLTSQDLSYAAAEKIISDLKWDKSEIGALVFVSQTMDYTLPATACILQDRLGLSKECAALDIAVGCSGWVYGLTTIAGLLKGGGKRALLLNGEARHRVEMDDPLFGYAGTATALEACDDAESLKIHLGTDGDGFDAIIIPDGGCRNPINSKSFETEIIDGKEYNRLQYRMKGMDVFSFGISTAPKSIKGLAEHFGFDYHDADFIMLHQANLKMNDFITKKLKVTPDRVPTNMEFYGNTSSCSIPLNIVTELRDKNRSKGMHLICCGFGVGLSWGTAYVYIDNRCLISNLVEVSDNEINGKYIV